MLGLQRRVVARTSISEAFHNEFREEENNKPVARTSISEAFHNLETRDVYLLRVARTSISEAFHNKRYHQDLADVLHGPPFQRPFTTVGDRFLALRSCTDLHFRGLSQHRHRHHPQHYQLHGPPFQRPFTTIGFYGCQTIEVARTSISEAFHNWEIWANSTGGCCTDLHFRGLSQLMQREMAAKTRCTDLHFRGLSQPIRFIFPSSPFVY